METAFPLIKPELTRVHQLNSLETALEEFEQFLKQYVSLIVLGDFENDDLLIGNAHKLCVQQGAHPKQRILWIRSMAQLTALHPKLEAYLKASFPNKEIHLDNIRAIAFEPRTKKAAYLIFVDPSLSDDPADKRKGISTFQMQKAFNAAIKIMPAEEDMPAIDTTQPTLPTDRPIL